MRAEFSVCRWHGFEQGLGAAAANEPSQQKLASARQVSGPTLPSTTSSLSAWNCRTEKAVAGPKTPSTKTGLPARFVYPAARKIFWIELTAERTRESFVFATSVLSMKEKG